MAAKYEMDIAAFPLSATQWTLKNLERQSIYYQTSCSSVAALLSNLKNKSKPSIELTDQYKTLIKILKRIWNFSFDTSDVYTSAPIEEPLVQFSRLFEDFDAVVKGVETEYSSLFSNQTHRSILYKWKGNMVKFLNYWEIFLQRWQQGERIRWKEGRSKEGIFTQLFMTFSEVCLLTPEIGTAWVEELQIEGRFVSSAPDVRFPKRQRRSLDVLEVATVTEVKTDCLRGEYLDDSTFKISRLPDDILGQHGAELLIEVKNSAFHPAGVGIICIGTKVLFTLLEMDKRHFFQITGDWKTQSEDKRSSYIQYTRPYDYMDATDRAEILEFLFWLATIQSSYSE